ncbi:MAG: undecaprenyl/decaprenyl-phosphate alpha-N-acetylglucosaminyl 1-phosphate transferase [Pirellulales bacterium]|nr:undecaprenyl/decaprenyl-phosphate alpha-N-acetylglucosaminyl 1-phosphate transferase [Pirellulales bacterium]
MSLLIITFLTALAIAWVITPLIRTMAKQHGAIDRPDGQRKLQKKPVPLWGGVAVYIAFCASLLIAALLRQPGQSVPARLTAVLAFSTSLLSLVGLLDDAFNLRPRSKLLLQFLAASPVVLMGFFPRELSGFGFTWSAGWMAAPLALIWLVGCINAVNLLDGLDGFASAVGIILSATIATIAIHADNLAAATAAMALAGAILGFFRYNYPPATIYLGDTGSMMIGLVLGELTLFAPDPSGRTVSFLLPAILMAVPFWDMVIAMTRRSLRRISIGTPDREHLHHRLIARGLSNHQALAAIVSLCLTTAAAAFAVSFLQMEVFASVVVIGLFGLLAALRITGHVELQLAFREIAHLIHQTQSSFHRQPLPDDTADGKSVTIIMVPQRPQENSVTSREAPDRRQAA